MNILSLTYEPRATARAILFLFLTISLCGFSTTATAQEASEQQFQAHLKFGEYPAAIEMAKQAKSSDQAQSDKWFREIAEAQRNSQAPQAAIKTVEMIGSDQARYKVLANFIGDGSGYGGSGNSSAGNNSPSSPNGNGNACLLYTSPSPRDQRGSRMPSSA